MRALPRMLLPVACVLVLGPGAAAEEPVSQRKPWYGPSDQERTRHEFARQSKIDAGGMIDIRGGTVTRVGVRTRMFEVRDASGQEYEVYFREGSRVKRDGRIVDWRAIQEGDWIERIRFDPDGGEVIAGFFHAASKRGPGARERLGPIAIVDAVGLESGVVLMSSPDGSRSHKGAIVARTKVYLKAPGKDAKRRPLKWTDIQEGDKIVELTHDDEAEEFVYITIERAEAPADTP